MGERSKAGSTEGKVDKELRKGEERGGEEGGREALKAVCYRARMKLELDYNFY